MFGHATNSSISNEGPGAEVSASECELPTLGE
jgi:hypothetical protein